MKAVFTIWKKELRDTIRDRRTLLSSIILPMALMPAILVGMGKLVQYQMQHAQEKTVAIQVANASMSLDFVSKLTALPKVDVIIDDADPQAAVRGKKSDLAVVLPDGLPASLDREEPSSLVVYQNSLNDRSALALSRLSVAIGAFNQTLIGERLGNAGLAETTMNGLVVQTQETATAQELGGFGLGFLLPLFIILRATIGGQYTAVDVSAGEKERKTLEALLLTPVRKIEVVFGKFCAVATASLLSVVVALSSLYVVFVFGGASLFTSTVSSSATAAAQTAATSFDFRLEPAALLVMFGVSILLVAFFSALNLTVSIFAKSFKEAQSYIGPSYLVIILPVVAFNSIPGFVPTTGYFAIPIVNAVLLFKEVLVGAYHPLHILLTVVTLAIAALLAIVVAGRIYSRERVLFKS